MHATALEFVEQVDQLLYKAKHNGRMRAEFSDFRD
jgi:PleD family two-component response regulator